MKMSLTKTKRRCTFATIVISSLLGGIEYAVILPTLYNYLDSRFASPAYFLGLVLASYSLTGMLSAPFMGRWYDVKRNAKHILLLCNLLGLVGNIMYWMGISQWFVLAARLISGLGSGILPVILAEISNGSTAEERTSIVSVVMAARQFGLVLGPGFNLFLRELDFSIGEFKVDKFSSPGLFLAVLYLLMQLMTVFLYYPLTSSTREPLNSALVVNRSESDLSEAMTFKEVVYKLSFDEIIALMMTSFVVMFNQTAVETIITPLSSVFLGWQELEVSIMFSVAGVEILFSFWLVYKLSKRYADRTLIAVGLLFLIAAVGWLLYWIPELNKDEHTKNVVVCAIGIALDVFGLPFVYVSHIALLSKLVNPSIQGSAQGVRRTFAGLASIIGPLWSGSLLYQGYLLFGVMLFLNFINLGMVVVSFRHLKPFSSREAEGTSLPDEKSPLLQS